MKHLKIIIGIIAAGILSWIFMMRTPQQSGCPLILEKCMDPLPVDVLYFQYNKPHSQQDLLEPELDSGNCVRLQLIS